MAVTFTILSPAAHGGFERLRSHTKTFICGETWPGRSVSISITQLEREGEHPVAETEEVGREIGCKRWPLLRNNAVAPHHSAREPACNEPPSRRRLHQAGQRRSNCLRVLRH